METTIAIVYSIIGALGLLYSIFLLLMVFRIWKVLEGISETIPKFQENRAKKYVRDTLRVGYIENPQKLTEASQILSKATKDDGEARSLLHKLNELKKQT